MRHLIINVGLGTSGGSESLAGAIVYSINRHRPDVVHFVVTEKSEQETLPIVKRLMEEEEVEAEVRVLRLKAGSEYDCREVFSEVKDYLAKLKREDQKAKIEVDFTAGTKPMSAGVVLSGCVVGAEDFSYVQTKIEDGKPVKGSESLKSFPEISEYRIEELKKLFMFSFDHYAFLSALEILKNMEEISNASDVLRFVEHWREIVNFYLSWDLFAHPFEKVKGTPGVPEYNKAFLGKLGNPTFRYREVYFLADLLNNAERRIQEGKFDDAVARLYRAVEMIAQIKLHSYGIETSDVEIERLPEGIKEKYAVLRNERGKVQLPLYRSYELLGDLGDELGKNFFEDHELRNLLERRNNSILAHGLNPVSEQECLSLQEKVLELAFLLHRDLKKIMGEGQFPKYREIDDNLQKLEVETS
jgi:hypothetical protein